MAPSTKELEIRLRKAVEKAYKLDPDSLTVKKVRTQVESDLGLEDGFFTSEDWKDKSKALIKDWAVSELVGFPRPIVLTNIRTKSSMTPKSQSQSQRPPTLNHRSQRLRKRRSHLFKRRKSVRQRRKAQSVRQQKRYRDRRSDRGKMIRHPTFLKMKNHLLNYPPRTAQRLVSKIPMPVYLRRASRKPKHQISGVTGSQRLLIRTALAWSLIRLVKLL